MKDELLESAQKAVKNWWVSLLVGILFVAVGIFCLFTRDTTLMALTIIFIVGFLVGGILEIVFSVSNRKILSGWGFLLAGGIIDVLFGILLIILPLPLGTYFFIYFVGFWVLFRSIWGIGVSIDMQQAGLKDWGWILAAAIIGILFSFLFILSPQFGGSFIVAFACISFIFYGAFGIYLAFKFKSLHNDIKKAEEVLEKMEESL